MAIKTGAPGKLVPTPPSDMATLAPAAHNRAWAGLFKSIPSSAMIEMRLNRQNRLLSGLVFVYSYEN